jgi:hypothetical protein
MVSATYLGNKTTHVWAGEEINQAVYIPGTCSGKPCSSTSNSNQRRLLYLSNPVAGSAYASIVESDQGGNSSYNGVLFSIQHRFANNFTLLTNYTLSHCISDLDFTGELAGSAYQNPANRAANRGDCNLDVRHTSNTSLVAISPGIGSGWVRRFAKDWQIAPILSIRSGSALNVTTGTDNSLTAVGQDHPNQVLLNAYPANQNVTTWINRSAFLANPTGTFGNVGRDTVRGPGSVNFDLSFSRIFRFTEQMNLEARAEAFNAINHANFGNPTTNLNSSNFGRILSANDPRILQFVMKFHF